MAIENRHMLPATRGAGRPKANSETPFCCEAPGRMVEIGTISTEICYIVQFASPMPYGFSEKELKNYKQLISPYNDWEYIKTKLMDIGSRLQEILCLSSQEDQAPADDEARKRS